MRAALALLLVARARAGGSLSAEVQALRKQTFKCKFGDTPEQRPLADGATRGWVAFTKQRSGSRWFVNTVVGRSGPHFGQRVNEIALGGLGKKRLDPTRDHEGCYGDKPSKRCSCALRQAYALRAHDRKHNPDHTQGFKSGGRVCVGPRTIRGSRPRRRRRSNSRSVLSRRRRRPGSRAFPAGGCCRATFLT